MTDLPLPAQCPHCGGQGCDFCIEGQTLFTLSDDCEIYTEACQDCGFENGMLMVSEKTYTKEQFERRKKNKSLKCIECGSTNVKWLRID